MKRPWHIGLIALFCLTVVFCVMGWITVRLLRAERRNREMQRQAAEENVTRLALWRMDAAVSPLIIEESARPYYEYAAFNPAETVNPVAYNRVETNVTLVPSPLLTQSSSNILAYFNGAVADRGAQPRLASPQVPTGVLNDWILDNYDATGIVAGNRANFNTFTAKVSLAELNVAFGTTGAVAIGVDPIGPAAPGSAGPLQTGQLVASLQDVDVQQQAMSANEQLVRHQQTLRSQHRIQSTKQEVYARNSLAFQNTRAGRKGEPTASPLPAPNDGVATWGVPAANVAEGVMKAAWIDDMLVLGRLVHVDSARYVQGAWLNWKVLEQELLAEIVDILPSARLDRALPGNPEDQSHVMATLPVRLIPGPCATVPVLPPPSLNVPLVAAWACVLIASLAVGLLVAGTVSLSERRAAFVSAVTHELRTPLTTFRMYSEMLSEGMVPEEKKPQYFEVLRAEGTRLSHLVENVLSYARIERGRDTHSFERMAPSDILQRVRDRLERRAAQAEMTIECRESGPAEGMTVRADLAALEQILYNLVDNACKYAARAADRRIHLELAAGGSSVTIAVRDHGPGISRNEAKRLFHPFRKSAKHAAETAPGVGLGLALSRAQARRLEGSLRVNTTVTDGACFELVLPVERN